MFNRVMKKLQKETTNKPLNFIHLRNTIASWKRNNETISYIVKREKSIKPCQIVYGCYYCYG